jgi:hypothetical protein
MDIQPTLVPDQLHRPTQKLTIGWGFQLFEGIDILTIRKEGQVVLGKLVNSRPVQQQVITLLGPQVQNWNLVGP